MVPRDADGPDRGEGTVVRRDGESVALYRDEEGKLRALSAVRPHTGCIVDWNDAESTWDRPCHGSRFSAEGAVIHGPALDDLSPTDR